MSEAKELFTKNSSVKQIIEIDYRDIEEVIEKHFGLEEFDIVADQYADNDSIQSFTVNNELTEYEEQKLEEYLSTREGAFVADALLNKLCIDGVIPKCELYVNICW